MHFAARNSGFRAPIDSLGAASPTSMRAILQLDSIQCDDNDAETTKVDNRFTTSPKPHMQDRLDSEKSLPMGDVLVLADSDSEEKLNAADSPKSLFLTDLRAATITEIERKSSKRDIPEKEKAGRIPSNIMLGTSSSSVSHLATCSVSRLDSGVSVHTEETAIQEVFDWRDCDWSAPAVSVSKSNEDCDRSSARNMGETNMVPPAENDSECATEKQEASISTSTRATGRKLTARVSKSKKVQVSRKNVPRIVKCDQQPISAEANQRLPPPPKKTSDQNIQFPKRMNQVPPPPPPPPPRKKDQSIDSVPLTNIKQRLPLYDERKEHLVSQSAPPIKTSLQTKERFPISQKKMERALRALQSAASTEKAEHIVLSKEGHAAMSAPDPDIHFLVEVNKEQQKVDDILHPSAPVVVGGVSNRRSCQTLPWAEAYCRVQLRERQNHAVG